MGTFSSALERGKKAASTADISNREIVDLFQSLQKEVLSATDGKVSIELGQGNSFRSFANWATAAARQASTGLATTESSMRSMFVVAWNPKAIDKTGVRLAGFEWPFEGYPCELSYSNQTVRCHDGKALVASLQHMLANAWVANKIVEIEGRE